MVHRDIKPSNLMLAREGNKPVIKILDFGLAKVTSEGAVDGGLTHEGQMLGTPDYIAPEQTVNAQKADIRADIYSLGCTLYYLLDRPPAVRRAEPLRTPPGAPLDGRQAAEPRSPRSARRAGGPGGQDDGQGAGAAVPDAGRGGAALTPFFKKGNVGSTGSKPEFSQAGRPDAKPATAGAGSVPTRPAAELQPAPEPSVRKPVETPRPKAMWKSLVDFTETEPVKKGAPAAALNRRPPWLWPAMAAGVLLLGLVVVLWFKTSNGMIEPPTKPTHELPKDDDADSTLTHSIGMTLKRFPAGTFQMGSPDGAGNEDERPQYEVRITRPFYLGVTEVSQAQYEAVMGNNPSYFSATGHSKDKIAGQSTVQHPVETVYWLDAVKFCNKLSELEGRKPFYEIAGETVRVPDWKASGYRLPTEAEWEYACGGDPADLEEHAWFDKNSRDVTHPVGKKLTNRFGLHDMLGNVAEWCWDAYDKDYYKQSPPDDPTGPDIAGAASRVFRGGSWLDERAATAGRRSVAGTRPSAGTTTWASAWPCTRPTRSRICRGT